VQNKQFIQAKFEKRKVYTQNLESTKFFGELMLRTGYLPQQESA